MNRLINFFAAVALMISVAAGNALAQDVAPKFTSKFFPGSKVSAPVLRYAEQSGRNAVYLWVNQPQDIVALIQEREKIDDEGVWEQQYGCNVDFANIQLDCKIDGGNYQYQPSWDKSEFQEDIPYDLLFRTQSGEQNTAETFRMGSAIMDASYSGEQQGFMKELIRHDGDEDILDLENHTVTIRGRYIVKYRNDDGESFLTSAWSNEISFGKNGTQKTLEAPSRIEAPQISEFKYERGFTNDAGNRTSEWTLYVKYLESQHNANMYYAVNGHSDALAAVTEYRVNGGEWQETYWGNPDWLTTGYKHFSTPDTKESDKIEFRVHLENRADDNLQGEYSQILVAKNGNVADYVPEEAMGEEGTAKLESHKCKVCGICPIQPLGICLFIWIAIILIIIILIAVMMRKGKKEDK